MKRITRANTIEIEKGYSDIAGQTQTVNFSSAKYFFARYILTDRVTCTIAHRACIKHGMHSLDYPPSERYYRQMINRLLCREVARLEVTISNNNLHMNIYIRTKNTIRSLLSINLNNNEKGVPFDQEYLPLFLRVKAAIQGIPGNQCGGMIAPKYTHYFTVEV